MIGSEKLMETNRIEKQRTKNNFILTPQGKLKHGVSPRKFCYGAPFTGALFRIYKIPAEDIPGIAVYSACRVAARECEATDALESTNRNLHASPAESLFERICMMPNNYFAQ